MRGSIPKAALSLSALATVLVAPAAHASDRARDLEFSNPNLIETKARERQAKRFPGATPSRGNIPEPTQTLYRPMCDFDELSDQEFQECARNCLHTPGRILGPHYVDFRDYDAATGSYGAWRAGTVACMPQGPNEFDPREALLAFENHSWPKAALTLDPSHGLTLVNKTTTATTVNPGPITKDFTLLGQAVTIEATPKSWTWHWGDNTTDTTTHPGTDGTISHAYPHAGQNLNPRVDVTYTGRWKLADGAWQTIPTTHTVTGNALNLDVHEAVIHLTR